MPLWIIRALLCALLAAGRPQLVPVTPASRPATQPALQPTSRLAPSASQPASQPDSQPALDAGGLSLIDNFHAIAPQRAFRSGQLSAETLKQVLRQHGIRTVINLRGANPDEPWYRNEVRACAEAGVTLVDVRMSARNLPAREELLKLFDAFATASEPLLMHCESGADRSGAAAAIWRMQIMGHAREDARAELSLRYGHLRWKYPKMDELIERLKPEREWILNEFSPD